MRRLMILVAAVLCLSGFNPAHGAEEFYLVAGTGPNEIGSQVKVLEPDGTPILTFTAFLTADNPTEEVRVAVGDVNGDGDPEIVTVPGSTPAGRDFIYVNVFETDLTSATLIQTIVDGFAVGSEVQGAYVACGDVDGDGVDEIIVGDGPSSLLPDPYPYSWVKIFEGDGTYVGSFMAFAGGAGGTGVPVAAVDLDGDRDAEVALCHGPNGVNLLTGRFFEVDGTLLENFYVFSGDRGAAGGSICNVQYDADAAQEVWIAHGTTADTDSRVRVVDDNGDLKGEIVAFDESHGVQVTAGDFDGDGVDELAVGQNASGSSTSLIRILEQNGDEIEDLPDFQAFTAQENPQGGVNLAAFPRRAVSLAVERADPGDVSFPDVLVMAAVLDPYGNPWDGDVEITAFNPDGYSFSLSVSAVTNLGNGQYSAVVSCSRAGEVTIRATAGEGPLAATADVTVVFLPYVATGWGIPRAVSELNTDGQEDSISISPDGKTLFFSYTPMSGCSAPSQDPLSADCSEAYGPYLAADGRPGIEGENLEGVNPNGSVTLGLYGYDLPQGWDHDLSKPVFTGYTAYRQADGTFGTPTPLGFEDDGIITEASLVSGPVSPVPGQDFDLFFAYQDWLDFDGDESYDAVFAVATDVTAGEATSLGRADPGIGWNRGNPPSGMKAQNLTGPIQSYVATHDVGEFRLYQDPLDDSYALYYETGQKTDATCNLLNPCDTGLHCIPLLDVCTDDYDLVTSDLTGTYPGGDWSAGSSLPSPLNSPNHHDIFPWPVDLPFGQSTRKEIFYVREHWNPFEDYVARIMWSYQDGGSWVSPSPVLRAASAATNGNINKLALPTVTHSAFGTEMFFIYTVRFDDGGQTRFDLQIGVVPRDD